MKFNIVEVWKGIKELAFGPCKMPLYKKIGYLYLIPPFIGVYQYLSFPDLFDISKDSWEGIWKGDVELQYKRPRVYLGGVGSLDGIASLNSTIPAFIIAGTYLIKDRKPPTLFELTIGATIIFLRTISMKIPGLMFLDPGMRLKPNIGIPNK